MTETPALHKRLDRLGTPCRRNAASNPSHTGPAVARRTSRAEITNRELSSFPDTAFNSVPSARWKPIRSAPHPGCARLITTIWASVAGLI